MLDLRDRVKSEAKLSPKYYGPFTIIQKLSDVTFKVEWPERLVPVHPVFHASKLVPYNEQEFKGQRYPMPDPEIIGDHPEYEVEDILDARRVGRRKTLQYYVRWKGYSQDHDSWEPARNLKNAQELIEEFNKKHPLETQFISAEICCIFLDF